MANNPAEYNQYHCAENQNRYSSNYPSAYHTHSQSSNLSTTQSVSATPNNIFATNNFHPEEIFQLDQPIRTNYNPYASTFNANSDNYITSNLSTTTTTSRSPSMLLDLESGTIQENYSNILNKAWTADIKYESCDDTSSLTSTSSLFEEAFFTFQNDHNTPTDNNNGQCLYADTSAYGLIKEPAYVSNQFFDHCEDIAEENNRHSLIDFPCYYNQTNNNNKDQTSYGYAPIHASYEYNNSVQTNNNASMMNTWSQQPQSNDNTIMNDVSEFSAFHGSQQLAAYVTV